MATREFILSVAVPVSAREAIDHQVDMPRHLGLHPYLSDIRLNGRGVEDGNEWAEYLVLEHPRFLGVRYPVKFPVRVVRTSPTSYVAHVSAAPGCTLLIEATAGEDPDTEGGAILSEHVTVTAPWPLVGYMTRQAEHAHATTYSVLPEVIGRSDRRQRP
jgi:hypothetical protein